MKDPYKILGVSYDADGTEIKRAWRRLAQQYHPDKNPADIEAEGRFKEIADAYEILRDPQRKATVDKARKLRELRRRTPRVQSSPKKGEAGNDSESVGEMLGGLFGKAWRKATRRRGRDVSFSLPVELEDLVEGFETRLELDLVRQCPDCDGSGKQNEKRCGFCDGVGAVKGPLDVPVVVPPGAIDGQRIRHRGLGQPGRGGGSPGDLYIELEYREHPFFEVEDNDTLCTLPLSYAVATLGGEVEVPTLSGTARMRIPPGTASGKVFRLRNRGLPNRESGSRGDQYVTVEIEVPVSLTDPQRQLLEELERSLASKNQPRQHEFRSKVKARYGES